MPEPYQITDADLVHEVGPEDLLPREKTGVDKQGRRTDYYDFGKEELKNPPGTQQGHDFYDIYLRKVGHFGRPQEEGEQVETFGREDFNDFLTGKLSIIVNSSWVESVRYDMFRKAMQVVFNDGHNAVYSPIDVETASEFLRAPSKGQWIHREFKLGYKPDRTWYHKYPYYENQTLETFAASRT